MAVANPKGEPTQVLMVFLLLASFLTHVFDARSLSLSGFVVRVLAPATQPGRTVRRRVSLSLSASDEAPVSAIADANPRGTRRTLTLRNLYPRIVTLHLCAQHVEAPA